MLWNGVTGNWLSDYLPDSSLDGLTDSWLHFVQLNHRLLASQFISTQHRCLYVTVTISFLSLVFALDNTRNTSINWFTDRRFQNVHSWMLLSTPVTVKSWKIITVLHENTAQSVRLVPSLHRSTPPQSLGYVSSHPRWQSSSVTSTQTLAKM